MGVLSLTIGLLALICADLTLADGTDKPQQNAALTLKREDWAPVHYEVYDTKGYFQQPEKTFELLKELQKVYEPFSDEETNGRKMRINKLLAASEMDPKKCTRAYLKEFNELIKRNSIYIRTIVPYLTNHFIDFLSMCEDKALHHNIPLIKEEHRGEVMNLVRHIAEFEIDGKAPGFGAIGNIASHYAHLIRGILSYLGNKSGIKLDEQFVSRQSGKETLKGLFDQEVLKMCGEWVHATDPVNALRDYDVHLKLTDNEIRWTNYGRMCRYILEHQDNILLKMSYQFEAKREKDKESKVGFRKGFAKKFGFGKAKENAD